ncbi:MAG: hypothetical protein ACJ8EE_18105, partial [Bradyrhizobium sp.]
PTSAAKPAAYFSKLNRQIAPCDRVVGGFFLRTFFSAVSMRQAKQQAVRLCGHQETRWLAASLEEPTSNDEPHERKASP